MKKTSFEYLVKKFSWSIFQLIVIYIQMKKLNERLIEKITKESWQKQKLRPLAEESTEELSSREKVLS